MNFILDSPQRGDVTILVGDDRRIIVHTASRPQVPINVTFKADGSMEATYAVGFETATASARATKASLAPEL